MFISKDEENKITIKSIINKTLIGIFLSAPIIIVILMIYFIIKVLWQQ